MTEMSAGDTRFIPGATKSQVSMAMLYYSKRLGGKWTQKKDMNRKRVGVRVWCLEAPKGESK